MCVTGLQFLSPLPSAWCASAGPGRGGRGGADEAAIAAPDRLALVGRGGADLSGGNGLRRSSHEQLPRAVYDPWPELVQVYSFKAVLTPEQFDAACAAEPARSNCLIGCRQSWATSAAGGCLVGCCSRRRLQVPSGRGLHAQAKAPKRLAHFSFCTQRLG